MKTLLQGCEKESKTNNKWWHTQEEEKRVVWGTCGDVVGGKHPPIGM